MTTNQGKFITVEGIEGAGKSTVAQFIQSYLTGLNYDVLLTREPGGTPIAEQIRQILLNPYADEIVVADAELLLMFASRAQHIHKVILPALRAGRWVLSDRFVDATYAYQGGGRGLSMNNIGQLDEMTVRDCRPNLTFLLDLPPELGFKRTENRHEKDRIEREHIDFFNRVREVYLQRAKEQANRICVIDAAQSLEQVKKQISIVLDHFIKPCT